MRPRAALVVLVVVLVGLVPVASSGAASAAGFGATFHAWVGAHHENNTHCPLGGCYGPLVGSSSVQPEFSFVQTYHHRVVGYSEAIPHGTSVLAAELMVAEQFPSDVNSSEKVTVIYHDRYGHSCAVYDLYSATLANEFGPKGLVGQGNSIGVELATIGPKGAATWNPDAIDLAIVTPIYLDSSANC